MRAGQVLPGVQGDARAGVPPTVLVSDIDLQVCRPTLEHGDILHVPRLPIDPQIIPPGRVQKPHRVPLLGRSGRLDVVVERQPGAHRVVPVAVDIRRIDAVELSDDVSPTDPLVNAV